jgi:hypothetical protein
MMLQIQKFSLLQRRSPVPGEIFTAETSASNFLIEALVPAATMGIDMDKTGGHVKN